MSLLLFFFMIIILNELEPFTRLYLVNPISKRIDHHSLMKTGVTMFIKQGVKTMQV